MHFCFGGEFFLAEGCVQSGTPEVCGEAGQRLGEFGGWGWGQGAIV
jgi:hypothetical protein